MTEQQNTNKVNGNTKKAADMSLAKKTISPDSHRAVHEGRITLEEARELGREGSPFGPAVRVNKNDRTPTKTPCLCGCGELVPRNFKAGHDQRMVTLAKEYVRGQRELTEEQMEYVESSGKLERAKRKVSEEDRRKAAKEANKKPKK